MIKLVKFNKDVHEDITQLHKKLVNDNRKPSLVFYDTISNKKVGYCVFHITDKSVKIDWLYAPNYGKSAYKKLEAYFKYNKVEKILLNCSIDKMEKKETVMKRINFYIGLDFRVYDIRYRTSGALGVMLLMHKKL
jgi:hypothetical protein